MESKIKKIAILTSGGDAPGMNNAIRAIGRFALFNNLEVAIIKNGYKGLVEGDIFDANKRTFSNIINRGGTFIGTSRLPEFVDLKIRQKAYQNLKKHKIDALIVIGGDGTYRGALKMHEEGFKCIALPGTIDNDIASTDYTIGFFSSLNTIVNAIDNIRDTIFSHSSCCIIEVMGRHCGHLALHSSIASGADVVSFSEKPLKKEELIKKLELEISKQKNNFIIIVSEKLYDVKKLAKEIETKTSISTRSVTLGHIQRGGSPSVFDRILAAKLGFRAVELILENKSGLCLGIKGDKIVNFNIKEALEFKQEINSTLINIFEKTK